MGDSSPLSCWPKTENRSPNKELSGQDRRSTKPKRQGETSFFLKKKKKVRLLFGSSARTCDLRKMTNLKDWFYKRQIRRRSKKKNREKRQT
jgi:hypothetical protein